MQVAKPTVHNSGHIIWRVTDPQLMHHNGLQQDAPEEVAGLLQSINWGGTFTTASGFRPAGARFAQFLPVLVFMSDFAWINWCSR